MSIPRPPFTQEDQYHWLYKAFSESEILLKYCPARWNPQKQLWLVSNLNQLEMFSEYEGWEYHSTLTSFGDKDSLIVSIQQGGFEAGEYYLFRHRLIPTSITVLEYLGNYSWTYPGKKDSGVLIANLALDLYDCLCKVEQPAQKELKLPTHAELADALRWYVDNDETEEGGSWEHENYHWLQGKRKAQELIRRVELFEKALPS
jgi:hypothetical protein